MPSYIPLLDDPTNGAAQLDAGMGKIVFLAGLDRAEALAVFDIYAARTSRTKDRNALRIGSDTDFIQFAWETDIANGQNVVWTTVWNSFFIENRLFPSQHLINAVEAIILAKRVT